MSSVTYKIETGDEATWEQTVQNEQLSTEVEELKKRVKYLEDLLTENNISYDHYEQESTAAAETTDLDDVFKLDFGLDDTEAEQEEGI